MASKRKGQVQLTAFFQPKRSKYSLRRWGGGTPQEVCSTSASTNFLISPLTAGSSFPESPPLWRSTFPSPPLMAEHFTTTATLLSGTVHEPIFFEKINFPYQNNFEVGRPVIICICFFQYKTPCLTKWVCNDPLPPSYTFMQGRRYRGGRGAVAPL